MVLGTVILSLSSFLAAVAAAVISSSPSLPSSCRHCRPVAVSCRRRRCRHVFTAIVMSPSSVHCHHHRHVAVVLSPPSYCHRRHVAVVVVVVVIVVLSPLSLCHLRRRCHHHLVGVTIILLPSSSYCHCRSPLSWSSRRACRARRPRRPCRARRPCHPCRPRRARRRPIRRVRCSLAVFSRRAVSFLEHPSDEGQPYLENHHSLEANSDPQVKETPI